MADTTINVKFTQDELMILRDAIKGRLQSPTSPKHRERLKQLAERLACAQFILQASPIE